MNLYCNTMFILDSKNLEAIIKEDIQYITSLCEEFRQHIDREELYRIDASVVLSIASSSKRRISNLVLSRKNRVLLDAAMYTAIQNSNLTVFKKLHEIGASLTFSKLYYPSYIQRLGTVTQNLENISQVA